MNATTSPEKAALQQAVFLLLHTEGADNHVSSAALTDVLCAFADVVRGPAPELLTAELVADDTPRQLLCEVRELIYEIRADRQERAQAMRQLQLHASGLPG